MWLTRLEFCAFTAAVAMTKARSNSIFLQIFIITKIVGKTPLNGVNQISCEDTQLLSIYWKVAVFLLKNNPLQSALDVGCCKDSANE